MAGERFEGVRVDLYQNLPVPIGDLEHRAWVEALDALRRETDLGEATRRGWSDVSPRQQEIGASWMRRLKFDPEPRQTIDVPGVQSAQCAIVAAATPGHRGSGREVQRPDRRGRAHGFPDERAGSTDQRERSPRPAA